MPTWGNRGNRSLEKYADRFWTNGFGRFSFSIRYHDLRALSRVSGFEWAEVVRRSAESLAAQMRELAPIRSGDLRQGIIVLPGFEKSRNPEKLVADIAIDARMNDRFVKYSAAGVRYYYPASQEYGFRIGRGKRVPGLYYMRNAAVAFHPAHEEAVVTETLKILEEL